MTTKQDTMSLYDKIRQLGSDVKSQNILFQIVNKCQAHIIFNRPRVKNAFSIDMYFRYMQLIEKANEMPDIKYIVMRGNGGNFSSGNDLTNFMNPFLQDYDKTITLPVVAKLLENLTVTIVESRKPIFAVLEGQVVGFAFTKLALLDKVFAVQDARILAPLVKIAQGPEMASSYTFPKIFGQALAQQIIIKGKQMSPKELQKYGLVSSHKSIGQANKALQSHIEQLEQLDWKSYLEARKLMRMCDKNPIHAINKLETQNLVERWSNPDLPQFLMKYLSAQKQPKL